jgi:hypothetical protein
MRLWSIHPSYLDSKGLVALWREGLLAKKVLEGNTKGYVNHPQLVRFRQSKDPLKAINSYLEAVLEEATKRGYVFDITKIETGHTCPQIAVNDGQIAHEVKHLKSKLQIRDPQRLKEIPKLKVKLHPLFKLVKGPLEEWEKI